MFRATAAGVIGTLLRARAVICYIEKSEDDWWCIVKYNI